MALPSGKTPLKNTDQPKPQIIALITAVALKARLQQLKSENLDVVVVVKGSDEADYQNMINVLDVLQRLDIAKVGFATEAAQ